MNKDIERVEPAHTEHVPADAFRSYTKEKDARVKVVGDHYRWVYENGNGELVMVLPQHGTTPKS